MSNLKKIRVGQEVKEFPTNTFNGLIAGELRDRQRGKDAKADHGAEVRSPVVVRLNWDGEETLPPGNVVKLGDPILDPATQPGAPYLGLQFDCTAPESGDESASVAVTLGPIAAEGIGYGHLAGAVWAKLNITDAGHDSANVGSGTVLQSASGGRFKVVWKESGTGEKWAVVVLAETAAVQNVFGVLIADVPACTVTYRSSAPWTDIDPGEAADAVIPLAVDGTTFKAKLNDDEDAQTLLRAVNPFWPEVIKAGTTTNADKPVVVFGYETTWGSDAAFVITNLSYPVTIMKGLCQGAVAGSSFTADNLELWWGRNPGVSSISSIANPAALAGDDNAVCVIMQIPDGTWVCLGIECPA